jgi:hypothetical protein
MEELKQAFMKPDFSTCILGDSESESDALERMKIIYSRALAWEVQKDKDLIVGMVSNEVVSLIFWLSLLFILLKINFLFLFSFFMGGLVACTSRIEYQTFGC